MQKVRKEFRAICMEENRPCWLCGMRDIDYESQGENDSFSLDHHWPVSTHPEHREDPQNFLASHLLCNIRRSNKSPKAGLGDTSQDWGL